MSGERALITAIRARAASTSSGLRLGIGDDAAILRPPRGCEVVVTTDLSLEQVHFRRDWHPPESVGHRCLARGLSDLAAMGARPLGAFLSIALPPELTARRKGVSWLGRFLDGFLALAAASGVPLAGGDTAQSPPFHPTNRSGTGISGLALADIVLVGSVKRGCAFLRSGARPGDVIYVTGALGGAAAELATLKRDPRKFMRVTKAAPGRPHLYPAPRLGVAAKLASSRRVHSAIDLSDGLSTDLVHICEESGVAAEIEAAALPMHALAVRAEAEGWGSSALDLSLHGGEDYELLFTAPESAKIPRTIGGVKISAIGNIRKHKSGQPLVTLRKTDGEPAELRPGGWEHFIQRHKEA